MAYDPGAIDTSLAAAVGDDPALIAELRDAFLESVHRSVDMMKTSKGAEQWAGPHCGCKAWPAASARPA